LRAGEREIELRPKCFALLRYLVENAGRSVPKGELVQAIWPNVIVTDDSLTRSVCDVRLALNDGEQRIIKTVPRRGYLFAAAVSRIEPPVLAPSQVRESEGVALHPPEYRRLRGTVMVMSATLALASVTIGAGAFLWLRSPVVAPSQAGVSTAINKPPPVAVATDVAPSAALSKLSTQTAPRMSVVVLPFTNLSGDPSLEYFADGFTENMTAELSRISGSLVIARTTANTYKGKVLSAKEIAKELNVRYVLEGGVQKAGNHVRVNAQLIDGETDAHLWAEKYDRDSADLLQIQDEITKQIAHELGDILVTAESERSWRDHPTDPDSLDLTLRADAMLPWPTAKSAEDARRLYERAVELNPNNVDALTGLAETYVTEVSEDWVTGSGAVSEALKRADDAATRALSINPRSATAYEIKSHIFAYRTEDDYRGEIAQAIAAAETALDINANRPQTLAWLARLYAKAGHPERTAALVEQAARLDPARAKSGRYLYALGIAQLQMGQNDEAIDTFQRSVLLTPNSLLSWGGLTAAFIGAGREVEARRALVKWREAAASQASYKADYSPDSDVLYVRMQLALLRLGRWPYAMDLSTPGNRSFPRALLKFQADEKLPQTGQPDEATLARLGISSQVTASASNK
jgi:TolB-like protein/DNA-binding winged helix-turn-helix (wHTH) protein/Tfp pilus assembly protein PilF